MTGNQECVNDIAASEVLAYLLMVLQTLPTCRGLVLETLYPLSSNTKLLKEALAKGTYSHQNYTACNKQTIDALVQCLRSILQNASVQDSRRSVL